MKETLEIEGMSCQHCVRAVASALAAIDGVTVQTVDIGKAIVERADHVDRASLVDAVAHEGYVVKSVGSDSQ
jgi:copper chaperone CopZ